MSEPQQPQDNGAKPDPQLRPPLAVKFRKEQSATRDRRRRFSQEYVIDLDGQRAAKAAGFSAASAHVRASELLNDPFVLNLIERLEAARASKLGLKADRVIEELMRVGFSNMLDYIRVDGDGLISLDFSNLTRDQAACIQEFTEDATGGTGDGERRLVLRRRFKLADKLRALELLGKHLGMFTERVKVEVNVTLADSVREARERLKVVECLPLKKVS